MARTSKSPVTKRPRIHPKYAYTVVKTGIAHTAQGVPIILSERKRYVCGGCLLLLKTLDVRFSSPSPSLATHLTPPWRTTPFVASKCGCELSFLWLNQSSFPNSQRITESTFMGFCLTCHCITEIRELVDGLLRKGPNEKRENWPDYGDAVMWMQSKLTAHPDWHSISPSTSPKEQGK